MVSLLRNSSNEYLDLVNKCVDPAGHRLERAVWEEKRLKEAAFLRNKQHFRLYRSRFEQLPPEDDDPFTIPYRHNKIEAYTAQSVAMLLAMEIDMKSIPPDASFKDREVARNSEKVLEHILDATKWHETLIMRGLYGAATHGSQIMRIYWDPRAGEPDRFYKPENGSRMWFPENLVNPETARQLEAQGLFEDREVGEIRAELVSPFSFWWDTSSRDQGIEGCMWTAERHLIDRERAADILGLASANDLATAGDTKGARWYEEAVAFMDMNPGFSMETWSEPEDKRANQVTWIELYRRPSRLYPKGLRLLVVGGKLWGDNHDNPYIADKSGLTHLPHLKLDWKPLSGSFWGQGLVDAMTNAQWHSNRAGTALSSFLYTHGAPMTIVGKQSGIDPNKLSMRFGRTYAIDERSSKGVTFSPTPQLPKEVVQFGAMCDADMAQTASQSEMDGSKLPGQLRSAPALDAFNRARHIALNIPGKCLVAATAEAGRRFLTLGQKFYRAPRKARYMGEEGHYVVEWFTGADISNDIKVIGEPSVLDTKESRKAALYDAVQIRMLTPDINPEDRRIAIKAIHDATNEEWVDRVVQAERNQEIEIERMIEFPDLYRQDGYPIADYEDHATEANQCVAFMYTQRYRSLKPEIQALIMRHWKSHADAAATAQLQQMQIAQALQGTPGQKGAASQPKAA